MRTATTLAALLLLGPLAHAHAATQQTQAPQTIEPAPAGQTPTAQTTTGQTPTAPAPGAPPVPSAGAPVAPPGVIAPVVPPLPPGSRIFTAKTGLIFQSVRPERVVDFETVIGYLKAAIEKSTDSALRARARGFRVFKATEPGPNGTVTYVFIVDPVEPGADYGLGRILADAYPDQIQEIWKLYTGSLGPGATLLNLTPVEGMPAAPVGVTPPPATTAPGMRPAPPPAGRGIEPPTTSPATPPAIPPQ
jgi:hypothetical protein